ncbi:MFS transporter [Sphaerisporangium rufum]|uniref:MFS transporter n=1 Tax=Sphaerisporangium rufum TaxID=1381558 RepID=A0A919V2E0_9ACTN|nr:MFS transporter [Sphaerisporangium rufum]GII79602.1 MFS transporter [Sphaerisporangium rufum]
MREALARAGAAAAGAGRGAARAGRAAARATAGAGRGTAGGVARAGRGVRHATRRLTHAQGAGRTGLGRLIELTAAHSAGDALVTVCLAGTLLFGLPVDQARGQVALYLLITTVPFSVLAPFVGPALDRFRSGRRYVMAGTLFARGLLCWALAAAVVPADAVTLFPAALAVLVLSKAYNVSRAATMPSVLPADITLVAANARVALFALVSAALVAPVAAGLAVWLGAEWVLRGTTAVFIAAGVAAVRLPRHVDAPDLDLEADDLYLAGAATGDPAGAEAGAAAGEPRPGRSRAPRRWRTLLSVGPVVGEAVRANAAVRVLSGFLVFFLLFLVREGHLPGRGLPHEAVLAMLAAAAGTGGLAGAAVASWVRGHSPQLIVLLALGLTTLTAAAGAVFFSLWTALALALVAGLALEVGKLALDAIVQREIGEEVRSSTFGVVEALLQVAWVAGGLAGLALSLVPGRSAGPAGLWVMTAALAAALAWLGLARHRRSRALAERVRREREAPRGGPVPPDSETPRAPGPPDAALPPGPAGPAGTRPLTDPHG